MCAPEHPAASEALTGNSFQRGLRKICGHPLSPRLAPETGRKEKIMLTRLADRFEEGPNGPHFPIKIVRYGMWGTTAEIERRKKGLFVVVHKNKQEKKFKTLEEAEVYLTQLAGLR
jgi:hypothetical protein